MSLKDSERRSMLRFLGEEKYDEVISVLGSFPHIAMETKLQGPPPPPGREGERKRGREGGKHTHTLLPFMNGYGLFKR